MPHAKGTEVLTRFKYTIHFEHELQIQKQFESKSQQPSITTDKEEIEKSNSSADAERSEEPIECKTIGSTSAQSCRKSRDTDFQPSLVPKSRIVIFCYCH